MMLLTIRPGPVVHVWRDGAEVAADQLSPSTAITLARDLLAALPNNPVSRKGNENG